MSRLQLFLCKLLCHLYGYQSILTTLYICLFQARSLLWNGCSNSCDNDNNLCLKDVKRSIRQCTYTHLSSGKDLGQILVSIIWQLVLELKWERLFLMFSLPQVGSVSTYMNNFIKAERNNVPS